jgi:hypothetical protein
MLTEPRLRSLLGWPRRWPLQPPLRYLSRYHRLHRGSRRRRRPATLRQDSHRRGERFSQSSAAHTCLSSMSLRLRLRLRLRKHKRSSVRSRADTLKIFGSVLGLFGLIGRYQFLLCFRSIADDYLVGLLIVSSLHARFIRLEHMPFEPHPPLVLHLEYLLTAAVRQGRRLRIGPT